MPRTEKRFGDVSQPAAETFYEIVPASNTSTRNVLINIAGRGTANVTVSAFTSAPQETSSDSRINISLDGTANLTKNNGANGMIVNKTSSGVPSIGLIFEPSSSPTVSVVSISEEVQSEIRNFNGETGLAYNVTRFNCDSIDSGSSSQNGDYGLSRPISFSSAFFNETLFVATENGDIALNTDTSTSNATYVLANFTDLSTGIFTVISRRGGLNGSTALHGISVLGPSSSTSALGYALFSSSSALNNTTLNDKWGLQMISESSDVISEGTISFNVSTSTATMSIIRGASFFLASDYNSVHPVYAFSHPTAAGADNSWYGQVSSSASTNIGSVTLPLDPSNAGFRLVDTSTTTSDDIRKIFDGTITYPAAPTGVNVPSDHSKNQVVSIKFSPNGKYLAVAYRRPADITSASDAAIVIYSRQNDGSYTYSANSGTDITRCPKATDAMAWTADSGGIIVLNDTSVSDQARVQLWRTGLDSEKSISRSEATSWENNWTKYPPAKSLTFPSLGVSKLGSFSGSISLSVSTLHNAGNALLCYPLSGGDTLVSIVPVDTGGRQSDYGNLIINRTISGSIGSGTYPGYVNTFVPSVYSANGSITQVSNIVVNPGESLYVQSDTGDSVDISASGVEIT